MGLVISSCGNIEAVKSASTREINDQDQQERLTPTDSKKLLNLEKVTETFNDGEHECKGSISDKLEQKTSILNEVDTVTAAMNRTTISDNSNDGKENHDVYISYCREDIKFVNRLIDYLTSHNVKPQLLTNVIESTEPVGTRGSAIVNAKIFIVVLSLAYVRTKTKQDEISLAYISNKPILPVALQYFKVVNNEMDFGLKLTLSRLNWTFFCKEKNFEKGFETVLEGIDREIGKIQINRTSVDERKESINDESGPTTINIYLAPDTQSPHLEDSESSEEKLNSNLILEKLNGNFWDRHFSNEQIAWSEFRKAFISDYDTILKFDYPNSRREWLLDQVLWKDMFNKSNVIYRSKVFSICEMNWAEPHAFWHRVTNQSVCSLAMYEVFSMQSTVRMAAVENLGKYETPAVISALNDLLGDADPNIRAIAAIAIARTGARNVKYINKLKRLLRDEDRLVRESACLSLGHMKAESSVIEILDLWRNDPISHVREAALIALEEIGGEEAERAIHVAKVLGQEMSELNANFL